MYGFPNCQGKLKSVLKLIFLKLIFYLACECNAEGSLNTDRCGEDGKCACKENITGDKCDQCAEGFTMDGFPTCGVEVNIRFHVIDALYNKGMKSVPVKTTTHGEEKTVTTDEEGFAPIGPFHEGDEIKVDVQNDGYDAASQTLVAGREVEFDVVGLNPTVSLPN